MLNFALPSDISFEECVIGSILCDSRIIEKVKMSIRPEIFYKDEHSTIIETLLKMEKEEIPIDAITLTNYLKKSKKLYSVGGGYAITILSRKSAISWEYQYKVLCQLYVKRELIRIGSVLIEHSKKEDTDPGDTIEILTSNIDDLIKFIMDLNFASKTTEGDLNQTRKYILSEKQEQDIKAAIEKTRKLIEHHKKDVIEKIETQNKTIKKPVKLF